MDYERDTLIYRVKVPKEEMAFFNFLLESYEGLASSRTVDASRGEMELYVPVELEGEFVAFLEGLKEELPLEWSKLDLPESPQGLP